MYCAYFTNSILNLLCKLHASKLKINLKKRNHDFFNNIRSLLSIRDISKNKMMDILKYIIEYEAAKSQKDNDIIKSEKFTHTKLLLQ